MTRALTLAVVIAVLTAAGCGPDDATAPAAPRTFRFDSGGAHHIQGFGAWRVVAEEDGRFAVSHQVRDEGKDYPEVVLAEDGARALWTAIDAADLATLSSSDRPGVPDESQLTFVLEREGETLLTLTLWANDVRGQLGLDPILAQLRRLIESHHGVKPMF